jgi:hypothetical protein
MRYERRRAERVQVSLEAIWEGDKGRHHAEINDISTLGCYLLSGGEVKDGELIMVEIHFPIKNKTLKAWGTVVNPLPEIGFGLNFTSISEEGKVLISRIVDRGKRKKKNASTLSVEQDLTFLSTIM